MAPKASKVSRRSAIKGVLGLPLLGGIITGNASPASDDHSGASSVYQRHRAIFESVQATPFVDTHEHLIEEHERLQGAAHPRVVCDDWAILLSHYLDSDLLSAGMPRAACARFFAADTDALKKWDLLAPYWPRVRNTGYGQAVQITLRRLYGVNDLSTQTVDKVQSGYEATRRPGFYRDILVEKANIESCQVNCLTGEPFKESRMPTLLMQDISIVGMFSGPDISKYSKPTGIRVQSLADWHRVIDWWFDQYGPYAVAVKSQNAYSRDIDYVRTPPEKVEGAFLRALSGDKVSVVERKSLEDHLFWYAVDQATAHQLPVKLHTGYYAGQNSMPLGRLQRNPGSATDLCRAAPDTRFVFMHIGYPFYEEMLALAKQWTNASIDMCWSWIINPLAAKDFFKKYLVTAPANKLLPFGGDYIPVEPVLGHATIARQGMTLALAELVDESWLTRTEALRLIPRVMNGNAKELFRLEEKTQRLRNVSWRKEA